MLQRKGQCFFGIFFRRKSTNSQCITFWSAPPFNYWWDLENCIVNIEYTAVLKVFQCNEQACMWLIVLYNVLFCNKYKACFNVHDKLT